MAEPLISRKRSWTGEQKNARKKRNRKLKKQVRKAEARAKYGKSGKPAPVVVKRTDGTVVEVDQRELQQQQRQYSPMLENLALSEGFESYAGYLASTVWRDLRRRALTRDQWRCRLCGAKKTLQVHHDHYNVPLRSDAIGHLKTMCSQCHRRIHGKR